MPDPVASAMTPFLRLTRRKAPVVGVGVWIDGQTHLQMHVTEGAEAPPTDSLFEIGSITKTFTALLLADMVGRGEVALEDPVAKYLPVMEKRTVPGITLCDLATHTSGFPRIPRDLLWAGFSNKPNPYVGYDLAKLEAALGHMRIKKKRRRVRYSNLGFATLGLALARAADRPYEDLVLERVCGPLELANTAFPPTSQLEGHRKVGKPEAAWDLASFAPAGGLRSTLEDLLSYLRAHMNPSSSPLRGALSLVQEPRIPIRKDRLAIALAWMILTKGDRTVVWHNGGTGGFSSFAAFEPERDVALVALASGRAAGPLTRIGLRALEQLGPNSGLR